MNELQKEIKRLEAYNEIVAFTERMLNLYVEEAADYTERYEEDFDKATANGEDFNSQDNYYYRKKTESLEYVLIYKEVLAEIKKIALKKK